jgi:hypothetical protein
MFNAGKLIHTFFSSFIQRFYLVKIRIPENSNIEYYIPELKKVKGIQRFYKLVDDNDKIEGIVGFASWSKRVMDKRIRSIYLKLPDFSLVEITKPSEV